MVVKEYEDPVMKYILYVTRTYVLTNLCDKIMTVGNCLELYYTQQKFLYYTVKVLQA